MNISLTLNFDTLAELQGFMAGRAEQTAMPVAAVAAGPAAVDPLAAAPLAEVVQIDPAAAMAADPLLAQAVAEVAEVDPLAGIAPAAAPGVDLVALREALMGKLRQMAETMPEPAKLGKFINGFGVARFSEIDDDDLVAFAGALKAEFKL